MRHPEGLVVIGPLAFGRRDRALLEGSGVIWKGRREVYWAQEHIDLTEVAAPGGTGRHTAVLLVDDLRERREVLTRLLKGEEQAHMETERFVVPHRVHSIGPAFYNRRAGSGEFVHSIGQRCGDLAGDGHVFMVEHDADTKILQPGMARWRQCPRVGLRLLVLGPAGDAQCCSKVAWRSAKWPHRRHVHHVARRWWGTWWLEPAQRNDPGTRLQSVDSAEARRNANGAYQIGSVFKERHPSRQCCGRSAGGAARRARGVPRIVGDAEELVGCLPKVAQHEGYVGLSDDGRACLLQAPCDRCIPVRNEILEGGIAPGGVQSSDIEAILNCHRYAVQRSGLLAMGGRLVGGVRFLQGSLAPELYDSVQRGVGVFDSREQHLGELARRALLMTNRLCRVGR